MDLEADTRLVANPARDAARKTVKDAQTRLDAAERALPQLLNDPQLSLEAKNAALPGAHARIRAAQTALDDAKAALRPVPAKVPATTLDPHATRARPHLDRRGLQMLLRLLAFNAEAWLAEQLNTYLADPDEYRAITRHLLHQDGQISYTATGVTVTLTQPEQPPRRPRPAPAHRAAEHHTRPDPRRPPPHHLPALPSPNLDTHAALLPEIWVFADSVAGLRQL